jgi:hypothetical protein
MTNATNATNASMTNAAPLADQDVVLLPYISNDIPFAIGQLAQLLLAMGDSDLEDQPLPAPFPNGQASGAIGRLASFLAAVDRGQPPNRPVVVRVTLNPLLFVPLSPQDRSDILGAAGQIVTAIEAGRGPLYELIDECMGEAAMMWRVRDVAHALTILLAMPWDDDARLLYATCKDRLTRSATDRVPLYELEEAYLHLDDEAEQEAHLRVSRRLTAVWQNGGPRERYVYYPVHFPHLASDPIPVPPTLDELAGMSHERYHERRMRMTEEEYEQLLEQHRSDLRGRLGHVRRNGRFAYMTLDGRAIAELGHVDDLDPESNGWYLTPLPMALRQTPSVDGTLACLSDNGLPALAWGDAPQFMAEVGEDIDQAVGTALETMCNWLARDAAKRVPPFADSSEAQLERPGLAPEGHPT